MVKRGLLFAGLVIVADLAILAVQQRAGGGEDLANTLNTLDDLLSVVLFSLTGLTVYRDTGFVRAGIWAGTFAGLVVGAVVGTAVALTTTPNPGEQVTASDVWLWLLMLNALLGALFAALGAWLASRMGQALGR